MNEAEKPYIYAGNLNSFQLYDWLSKQLLVLFQLNNAKDQQAHHESTLAELGEKLPELTEAAYSGIVHQDLDSIRRHLAHQGDHGFSRPVETETHEHQQGGSLASIHPGSQASNHLVTDCE